MDTSLTSKMTNGSLFPHIMYAPLLDVDKAYILVSNIFALLSLFGCMIIILCYVRFVGIRTTSRMLLIFVSFANILGSGSTLVQSMTYYRTLWFPDEHSFICQTAAGLFVFTQVLIALWTTAITFYLFLCVTVKCINVANRIVIIFHIFCWTMPMVVSLSADLSGVYGYDITDILSYQHPTTCWLSDRVSNALPWYLLTVEGWVLAAFVIGSLLYFPIVWSSIGKKTVGRHIPEGNEDEVLEQLGVQTANEQLRFIPIIYVCTRVWGTAYFLFTRYPDDRHLRAYDWLLIIKGIGDNSQGLVNAFYFCLATKQIRKLIKRQIDKLCCFCLWCKDNRFIGGERWMRVPTIVRMKPSLQRKRTLDGSDIDISGISLDLPNSEMDHVEEDEILFER